MDKIKVFLDTDVIISSIISQKGASYEVIKNRKLEKVISISVKKEVTEVKKRSKIKHSSFNPVKKVIIHESKLSKSKLLKTYQGYVYDEEDAHVVAGADKSHSRFLLTHNTKHYNAEKIKNDLGITVLKPGKFLQQLRSN